MIAFCSVYVRRQHPQVRLQPQIHGGGHERGWRAGTLPAPLVVDLGAASELAGELMEEDAARVSTMRERLVQGLMEVADQVTYNGHATQRLPGNSRLTFNGLSGAALMQAAPGLAVRFGSACTTEELEP